MQHNLSDGSQAGRDQQELTWHVQHPVQTRLVAEVSVSGQRFLCHTATSSLSVKLGVRCIELQGLAPA